MKTLQKLHPLVIATALCAFTFAGCETLTRFWNSQSGVTAAIEQFVLSEANAYFDGTLTEQQLIAAARARFSNINISDIIAVIETVLTRPSVVNAHAPRALTYQTKRPLVVPEKSEIQHTSFSTGVAFVLENSGTDAAHQKALLARRLGYHYRVWPSKIKPISDPAFDQGVSSVTGSP